METEHCIKRFFRIGDWKLICIQSLFTLNNDGVKLFAKSDEGFEKIVFDPEKKTVSVVVKNPRFPFPRTVDLSEAPEFFDAIRANLETLMTVERSKCKKVTANEDRTVFTVTY